MKHKNFFNKKHPDMNLLPHLDIKELCLFYFKEFLNVTCHVDV